MIGSAPNSTPPAIPAGILPGIQVLRAVAALMVVVHHAEFNLLLGFGIDRPAAFLVGSAGVDVFFVISGFIMLVSSRRLFGAPGAASTFLTRRLIRIVPLYWAVTSVYVLAFLLTPALLGRPLSGGTMAASYLFWPHIGLDGTMHPALVVGWTLNYEMFFYVLFAAAVALPQRTAVLMVSGALAATVVLARVADGSLPALSFWGEPIVLEFAAGIALGLAWERRAFVPPPIAIAAIAVSLAGFAWQIGQPIPSGWPRLLLYGLPALLLVGAVALARPLETPIRLPAPLVLLGDASYSLYVVHLLALTVVRLLAKRLGFAPETLLGEMVFVGLCTGAAILAALASYLFFERPVTRLLRAWVRSPSPRGPA